MANNKIQKIEGLGSLKQLKKLNLGGNQITDITPLAMNTELSELNLKGNTGIKGNRNNYTEEVEELDKIGEILNRNGKIYLDLPQLGLFTNYKSLNLRGQGMKTLEALEGFTELTNLNLSENNITLSDEKSQNILKSMTQLKTLDLSSNKVVDATAINTLEELTLLLMG